jgi:hypothetical protein
VGQFQGGSFDAWGPTAPGYGACREMTGPNFQSVFFRQLWSSNAKLVNFYMFYGYVGVCIGDFPSWFYLSRGQRGTSWGALPFPGVYSNVDLKLIEAPADALL